MPTGPIFPSTAFSVRFIRSLNSSIIDELGNWCLEGWWDLKCIGGHDHGGNHATLRVLTTRPRHTKGIGGLLIYPYFPEMMTGRKGMGTKDPQRSPRMKGSTTITREQSHNSRYKAAPESSQRPPLECHAPKGG